MINQDFTEFQPKRTWLVSTAVTAFVIIAGFSAYFSFQTAALDRRIADLQAEQKTAAETKPAGAEPGTAIRDALARIEHDQLAWAKIIEKIESTIPKLKEANLPIVEFRSYNGSENGTIAANVTTRRNAFDPFSDVALLIHAFAAEPVFKDIFIPSISKSLTPDGETVLSFGMNFEYRKNNF